MGEVVKGARFQADAGACTLVPRLQRSSGEARIAFRRAGVRTVAFDHYQRGCARVRAPRSFGSPEAILINTAGGLTDGDTLDVAVRWEAGSEAMVTSQAFERVYRARRELPARVRNRLVAMDGASAAWMPQPTILFDGARLDRALDVSLYGDARFLGCEMIVFGRTAMGETVRTGSLLDAWRLERDGRLLFVDRLGLDGDIARALASKVATNGAVAMATVVYSAADSAQKCDGVRDVLAGSRLRGGCTDLGGMLVARLLAPDDFALRRILVAVLERIRGPGGLPQLWRL